MKATKLLPIILPLFMMTEAKAQTKRYVNAAATGTHTGTSWATAYNDLQSALTAAVSGDTIWVAKGTYYPTVIAGSGSDVRDKTFMLTSGVRYFGGFAGTEAMLSDRDSTKILTTNATVLNGDIGVTGDSTDNAYHVVLGISLNSATRFNGFVIMNGNANGTGTNVLLSVKQIDRRNGGGIYLDGSALSMKNLMISNNGAANAGAGMHNRMGTISLTNATFTNNLIISGDPSNGGGAGMSNDSSYATLSNITFYRNNMSGALGGGGIKNNASGGAYTNIVFANNYVSGGNGGGAIYDADSSNPVMNSIQFNSNTASNLGGAMHNDNSKPVLNNVTFYKNFAAVGAGAMHNANASDAVLENTIFRENKTSGNGGAIQNDRSNPGFNNVTCVNNYAVGDGGAMYSYGGSSIFTSIALTSTILDSNRADGNGGGMYNTAAAPVITNSIIARNSAGMSGGGVYGLNYSGAVYTNVTIANNSAGNSGGGMWDDNVGYTKVRNCIVQGNIAPSATDVYTPGLSTAFIAAAVNYSIIGNKYYVLGSSTGTTFTAPTFIDTASNDFRLTAGSQAINTGDSSYFGLSSTPVLSTIVTDIRNSDRIMGTNIDLGAYETCADTLKPTIHIVASPDTAVISGTTVTFTASATILGMTPTYTWKKNGVVIAGVTGPVYTAIAGTNYKNGDTISVLLHSSSACATVDTASSNKVKVGVKPTTGINTITFDENSIKLFPNPNEGTFSIEGNFVGTTQYDINVTDLTGRTIYSENFRAPASNIVGTYTTRKEINMGSNKPGIYFLVISAPDQPRQVLRFVIR